MTANGLETKKTMRSYSKKTNSKAFTLIELLVVIAIIALLLAIMLPSLQKAKGIARQVVCMANFKSIGTGLTYYLTEYNDWLPGPNTSGAHISRDSGDNPPTRLGSRTEVIQKCDWYSPIFGEELGFSNVSEDRFVSICQTEFRCPANKEKYFAEYDGKGSGLKEQGDFITKVPIKELNTVSYSAITQFHYYSSSKATDDMAHDESPSNKLATVSPRYAPKFQKVGLPHAKIFATEGCRYRNSYKGLSLNAFYFQNDGGNYMHLGPVYNGGSPYYVGDVYNPEFTEDIEKYVYKHNKKTEAVFFDGHVEVMKFEESLDISMYWPKGSEITNADWTYDPTDYTGMKIK